MTVGDWVLTVTGEIVRIDRQNIDKSGRNPRYVLSFVVRADSPAAIEAPAEVTLPAELAVRIQDRELPRLTSVTPRVGDRLRFQARASGPHPATFYLIAIDQAS